MLGQLAELPQGGRADPQQPAHLARPVHPTVGQTLGPEQGLEQGFGLAPEIEGRIGTPDAAQTACAPFWRTHRDDPLPSSHATARALLGVPRAVLGLAVPTSPASPSP
jgi:hypothetical protein